jgi:hypothetical protein
MNNFTRITVPLSKDEFFALREAASKNYRHPREQARWLLRQVLVIADARPGTMPLDVENANRGAMDSDPQRTAVAV